MGSVVEGGPAEAILPSPVFPFEFKGVRIRIDGHVHRVRDARSYKRLVVNYLCGHGATCATRRGHGMNCEQEFGEWEPSAFLYTWSAYVGPDSVTRARHVGKLPTKG